MFNHCLCFLQEADGASLVISLAEEKDEGKYVCQISTYKPTEIKHSVKIRGNFYLISLLQSKLLIMIYTLLVNIYQIINKLVLQTWVTTSFYNHHYKVILQFFSIGLYLCMLFLFFKRIDVLKHCSTVLCYIPFTSVHLQHQRKFQFCIEYLTHLRL